jgi:uncharacterized repeat protein (TIGR01451 family)
MKAMRNIIFAVFFVLSFNFSAYSQHDLYGLWTRKAGVFDTNSGTSGIVISQMITDSKGNIYVCGQYYGTASLTDNTCVSTNSGGYPYAHASYSGYDDGSNRWKDGTDVKSDGIVSKYDNQGNWLWSVTIKTDVIDNISSMALSSDEGSLVFMGKYGNAGRSGIVVTEHTITYGTGASETLTFNTPHTTLDNYCLVKVSASNGAKIFQTYLGYGFNGNANGAILRLHNLVYNVNDFIYLYGYQFNASTQYCMYIYKYDLNGNFQESIIRSTGGITNNGVNSGISKNQSISNIYHVSADYGASSNWWYRYLYKLNTADNSVSVISGISYYTHTNSAIFNQNYNARYGIMGVSTDVNSDDTHLFLTGYTIMDFLYEATGETITNADPNPYPTNNGDGIIICYDPQNTDQTKNIRWMVNIRATGDQRISSCKFDETTQTLKVAGYIDTNPVNFNPRGTAMNYSASNGTAAFYAVYDMNGVCQKVEIMDAAGDEAVQTLDLAGDKVMLFGTFTGSPFQVDPSERLAPMRTTQSSAFLTQYSVNPLSVPESKPAGSFSAANNINNSYQQAYHSIMQCLSLGTLNGEIPALTSDFYTPANMPSPNVNPNYDGLVSITPNTPAGGYTVKVQAKNNKSTPAYLIAWIDFNGNGVFDATEASGVATVPANTANLAEYSLVWTSLPSITRAQLNTYLRIRLTSETVDGTWVAGDAADGEVEDYALTLDLLEITKTAVSNNKYNPAHAMIGDTITYTVTVKNKVQGNVTVFDPIPVGTDYSTVGTNPSSGTLTAVNLYGVSDIPAIKWDLGVKAANSVSTLTFKTRLTSYPSGVDSVFNIAYAVMNGDTIPSTGNACDMAIIIIEGPRANNDTVSTLRNTPVTVDVSANDDYPFFCTPELTVLEDSYNGVGSATVSDGRILYTPADGKSGIDSVLYQLKCSDDRISTAKVYVFVSNPLSLQYVACPNASVTMGFDAITGATYRWYNAQTGGTVSSAANSLTVTKGSAADVGVWLVEPRYGNFVFPRHRVELETSEYCGGTSPSGCAVTGRLLYKEDFGGNETSAPRVSSSPAAPGLIDINFCPNGSSGCGTNYGYAFEKYSTNATFQSEAGGGYDHTHPNDQTKGYYMHIDPAPSQLNYRLYGSVIEGLCAGINLNFTLWAANFHTRGGSACANPKIEMTIKDARTLDTIVTTGIFTLPRDAVYTWRQYGFDFILPDDVESIIFTITNKENSNNCNDWNLDDIEIRICTPPVTTNISGNDTTVCYGNDVDITGTYEADCTFGNELAYKWEFRHIDSSSWKTLEQENVTVDCESAIPADRTITKTISITSASKANEGYYRMSVSSQANIGSVNCRAVSDSVYVRIVDKFVAPDIRLQVCPSPPKHTVQLSGYLDSTDYNRIRWEQVSTYPVITNTETGLIYDANFHKNSTYTFRYTLLSPEYSGCGSTTAKVYMRVLNDRMFGKTVDTITICSSLATSRFINLNQIFGLELGGSFTYPNDPDNVAQDNTKESTAPSQYAGAVVFNAQKAYDEAGSDYDVTYKGVAGKRFDFVYTPSCVIGAKRVVLVVTP